MSENLEEWQEEGGRRGRGFKERRHKYLFTGGKKYKLPLRIKSESEGAGGKRDGAGWEKTEF